MLAAARAATPRAAASARRLGFGGCVVRLWTGCEGEGRGGGLCGEQGPGLADGGFAAWWGG